MAETLDELAERTLSDLLDPARYATSWDGGWAAAYRGNDVRDQPKLDGLARKLGVRFRHSVVGATYDGDGDVITMPPKRCFHDAHGEDATAAYYSTLLHEIVHATGDAERLKRDMSSNLRPYAREELVAELASVVLLRIFGLDGDVTAHTTYFLMYLEDAGDRDKAVDYALREALRAVRYVLDQGGLDHAGRT